MLRPQDSRTRELRCLDGIWDFALDPAGEGRRDAWWQGRLPSSRPMPVPASYNDVVPEPAFRSHVGDAWYQRDVVVPSGWVGRRIVLRVDAATHRGTVWVGDQMVASHEGGYTPFEVDVTPLATPIESLRLTIAVNNELSWHSMPPGEVLDAPAGRTQKYNHDFFNYAGLHRSVWLYSTPVTHISDVTVTTRLAEAAGEVDYAIDVSGPVPSVRVALVDGEGLEVASARGTHGSLVVPDVHPWRPGEGYLYGLEISVLDESELVDFYAMSVGVRTVEVRGQQFLINGEPFYFRGFGKHEDSLVRGKGHDPATMLHDFELMAWVGANSFRTAHYPHAEEVLEEADRRGIVVISETAAVGLNLPLAGGMIGVDKRPTFSDDTIDDHSRDVHAQALRELIARDKNHPSVVLWSVANEPDTTSEASRAYFAPLLDLARQLDPSRPVGVVNMFLAPPGRCRVSDLCDVVMINRYHGWYTATGDLEVAADQLAADLTAWQGLGKPILVTEYGADALPGMHTVLDTPWSEEYQAELLEMSHRVFDRFSSVVGEQVWCFADFATAAGVTRVGGNRKGVFTRDRMPKAAALALRRRWRS